MPPLPQRRRRSHQPKLVPCPIPTCTRRFLNASGRTQHYNAVHLPAFQLARPPFLPEAHPSTGPQREESPYLAQEQDGVLQAEEPENDEAPPISYEYHEHLTGMSCSAVS